MRANSVKFGNSSTAVGVLPSPVGANTWHRRATRRTTSSSSARALLEAGQRNVCRKPASRSRSSRPAARIAPTTSASTDGPSTCPTATSRARCCAARGRARPIATPAPSTTPTGSPTIVEEPYTTPADKPFSWQGRLRLVGGRTNVWARQSYRLSEQDLKGRSFDGEGEDWPLDLRRPRAVLRPGRTTTSASADRPKACRSCPTGGSSRRCR